MSGPVPWLPAAVGVPLSWCYGAAVRLRNAWWAHRTPLEARVPVVSVGNLVVGGSGKSPMVRWIAERLAASGRHPAIALRGYRRSEDPRLPAGDEAAEHARLLPGVPLAVGADRSAAIAALLARSPAVDVVVLDDGFQHRRLARRLDVVLVDATRAGLDDRLLPAGWLREPASGLARADAVVVTRASAVDAAFADRIQTLHGRPPVAWCTHALQDVTLCEDGREERRGVEWLAGRRLGTVSAIARPETFDLALREAGARVVPLRALRDHSAFSDADLARAAAAARDAGVDAVACTMKDWVKLAPLADRLGLPVAVPRVGIRMVAGEAALVELVVAASMPPVH